MHAPQIQTKDIGEPNQRPNRTVTPRERVQRPVGRPNGPHHESEHVMKFLQDNPFYDFVLAVVGQVIPSTRTGYKNIVTTGGTVPNPETLNVHHFRKELREALRDVYGFKQPTKSRVMISLAIGLSQKQYAICDLDNMVKSILDALKTVVYEDDRQVDVLHVAKYKTEHHRWNIGIKYLRAGDPLWHMPSLYLESPMGHPDDIDPGAA